MMPRLSVELESMESIHGLDPLLYCSSCGSDDRLGRWQEHDEHDKPEPIVVVLCKACSDRIVAPHARLYRELHPNEPWPGAMAICRDCRHRDGTRCTHPDARANGGAGVMLTVAKPIRVHLCRSPRRLSGWMTLWKSPAKECKQKEPLE